MDELSRAKIRDVKSKVITMLDERYKLEGNDTSITSPSKYWSDFCLYFDYLLDLPEEHFAKLRLHTYHLTSDNYQTYYFDEPARIMAGWDGLTKDLPSQYLLSEPVGGIGTYYNGRFLSQDVRRYQSVVRTLYNFNILQKLGTDSNKKNYILEIGGGYGGLVHHLSNILKNTTCFIVDLPEVFLYSASYLSLLNLHKRIYIYDPNDFESILQPDTIKKYDFVLIPNYKLQSLTNFNFDLVINVFSLQEMTTAQVETYLDFICKTCTGVFYSWNQDRQGRNKELHNLSDLLRRRFELVEVANWKSLEWTYWQLLDNPRSLKFKLRENLKDLARSLGILPQPTVFPHREYICKPICSKS